MDAAGAACRRSIAHPIGCEKDDRSENGSLIRVPRRFIKQQWLCDLEARRVALVCTVWYTAVCSSAVFVLFRMDSGPCLKIVRPGWRRWRPIIHAGA